MYFPYLFIPGGQLSNRKQGVHVHVGDGNLYKLLRARSAITGEYSCKNSFESAELTFSRSEQNQSEHNNTAGTAASSKTIPHQGRRTKKANHEGRAPPGRCHCKPRFTAVERAVGGSVGLELREVYMRFLSNG